MPVPRDVDAFLDQLTAGLDRELGAAWAAIQAEQQQLADRWAGSPATAQQRLLRALSRHVTALMVDVRALAASTLPGAFQAAYERGATAAAVSAGQVAVFSAVDAQTLAVLARDAYDDVLQATRFVEASTKALVRELARAATRDAVVTGKTAVQAGRDVARAIADRGVTAVVYADGSRHGLAEYGQMVMRTKLAETYQVAGFQQYEGLGVRFVEILDGPGCGLTRHDDPVKADGLVLPLEEARRYPTSHPNCVMEGTRVTFPGGLQQIVRAWYRGPAYTLVWSSPDGSHSATVGPNHPVLTSLGWRAAHLLREGDELFHHVSVPGTSTVGAVAESDLEQVPTAVEDVFTAAVAVGEQARVPATADHLHGDGVFCEDEVQVVDVEGLLLPVAHTGGVEHAGEGLLVGTDEQVAPLSGDGTLSTALGRVLLAPASSVGSSSVGLAPLGAHALVPEDHRFAGGAADPESPEPDPQAGGAAWPEPEACGDLTGGQSVLDVEADEVLVGNDSGGTHPALRVRLRSVVRSSYEGWVYDATTGSGLFTANSIIVSNCRRATSAMVEPGAEPSRVPAPAASPVSTGALVDRSARTPSGTLATRTGQVRSVAQARAVTRATRTATRTAVATARRGPAT